MTKTYDERPIECSDPACPCHEWSAKSASESIQGYPKPSEGEKIDSSLPSAPRIAMSVPDFDREWREAPESHKRYTERSEAQWWLMRGVWLGIQYERERGLLAIKWRFEGDAADGEGEDRPMKYTMTSPCDQCPFLNTPQMKRGFTLSLLRLKQQEPMTRQLSLFTESLRH